MVTWWVKCLNKLILALTLRSGTDLIKMEDAPTNKHTCLKTHTWAFPSAAANLPQHILSTKNTAKAQGCHLRSHARNSQHAFYEETNKKQKRNKIKVQFMPWLFSKQYRVMCCFLSLFIVDVTLGQIWNDLLIITALTVVYYG